MLKNIVLLALIFVSGAGIFRSSVYLSDVKNKSKDFRLDPPPLASFPSKIVDVLTFGFRPLYDNLVEIWILQYLLDQRSHHVDPELIAKNIEKALHTKPKREALYVLICAYFEKFLKRPDLCERSSLIGLSVLPESWKISMMQGYIYMSTNQKAKAATLYLNAANFRGSPNFLKSLGKRLAKEQKLSKQEYEKLLRGLGSLPGVQSFIRIQSE